MSLFDQLKSVSIFVFDLERGLASNQLTVDSEGKYSFQFSVEDLQAIQKANVKGIKIFVLSSFECSYLAPMLKFWGVSQLITHLGDPESAFELILEQNDKSIIDLMYLSNSWESKSLLKSSGFGLCASDAHAELKSEVDYVSTEKSGVGVVSDIIEKYLKLHKKW